MALLCCPVCLTNFPLLLYLPASLVTVILWLKFLYRQKAGVGWSTAVGRSLRQEGPSWFQGCKQHWWWVLGVSELGWSHRLPFLGPFPLHRVGTIPDEESRLWGGWPPRPKPEPPWQSRTGTEAQGRGTHVIHSFKKKKKKKNQKIFWLYWVFFFFFRV